VTSAGSSELIAVSSLCTYDIYRTYVNPKATGKQILWVSRLAVLLFGCFMGVLAIVLNKAGVSLGWMYLAMGVFIGSAVMPVAFLLLWSKANAKGAMAGAIIGMLSGVTTWLTVTQVSARAFLAITSTLRIHNRITSGFTIAHFRTHNCIPKKSNPKFFQHMCSSCFESFCVVPVRNCSTNRPLNLPACSNCFEAFCVVSTLNC